MSRNHELSAARAWAHNAVCISEGCTGDNDHARRTQHDFARAWVNATSEVERAAAVHRLLCIAAAGGSCADEAHQDKAAEIALGVAS